MKKQEHQDQNGQENYNEDYDFHGNGDGFAEISLTFGLWHNIDTQQNLWRQSCPDNPKRSRRLIS